jgi:ribosomal protein S18 acetylase RimI-like enzyme
MKKILPQLIRTESTDEIPNSKESRFHNNQGDVQMSVNIREAKEADIQLVRKHTVETAWTTFSESEKKQLDKDEWTKHVLEVFERLYKRETDRIFVAEDECHAFLGYLWVGESRNMMTGLNHGYIYDIFVKEEFRGKGIGRILMERAESYCRGKGYPRILLMVSTSNKTATKLYSRVGFKAEQVYMGKSLG